MTKHKILFGVVLVIAVLSAGLNVVQVIKNKNDIAAMKNPVGSVCGDKIIEKFNNEYLDYSLTNDYKFDSVLEIEKNKDSSKDVNCLAIQYLAENVKSEPNQDVLNKKYQELKDMSKNNHNPSLSIKGVGGFDVLNPRKGSSAGPSQN